MPLFKHPISRLRRRPVKHFSNLSSTDVAQSIGEELDKLVGTVRDPFSQKVCFSLSFSKKKSEPKSELFFSYL